MHDRRLTWNSGTKRLYFIGILNLCRSGNFSGIRAVFPFAGMPKVFGLLPMVYRSRYSVPDKVVGSTDTRGGNPCHMPGRSTQ